MLENYSHDDFEQFVKEGRPDVVGIRAYSCDLASFGKMLLNGRNFSPKTVAVIGGPHPSWERPDNTLQQCPALDYAFAGEAGLGFAPFLEQIESKAADMSDVAGLIWQGADDVLRANLKGIQRFYFRLPVVLNLLSQVRSFTQLKIIFNAFLRAALPARQS
jgi:hypothetical protein